MCVCAYVFVSVFLFKYVREYILMELCVGVGMGVGFRVFVHLCAYFDGSLCSRVCVYLYESVCVCSMCIIIEVCTCEQFYGIKRARMRVCVCECVLKDEGERRTKGQRLLHNGCRSNERATTI